MPVTWVTEPLGWIARWLARPSAVYVVVCWWPSASVCRTCRPSASYRYVPAVTRLADAAGDGASTLARRSSSVYAYTVKRSSEPFEVGLTVRTCRPPASYWQRVTQTPTPP